MPDKCFLDTNLWVYLKAQNQSPNDQRKRQIVEELILNLPEIVVSAQVLNDLANVLMKKFGFTESDTGNLLRRFATNLKSFPLRLPSRKKRYR